MLIRDRIFDKLDKMNMTQKTFSELTGHMGSVLIKNTEVVLHNMHTGLTY